MKLFTSIALIFSIAIAGCASAGGSDRVWRDSINLPNGGSAQSVTIVTGGQVHSVTIERFAGDNFAGSDRITVEGNDLDLWDANTMVAYAEDKFGGTFETRLRCISARPNAGPDLILGNADDGRSERSCRW